MASSQQWYYSQGEQQMGPVSFAQLKALVQQGRLTASELVWCEGMADWQPARQVTDLAPVFAAAPPPRTPAATSRLGPGGSPGAKRTGLFQEFLNNPRRRAQWLLSAGIVLAIAARGCNAVGNRNVARLNAKDAAASQRFDDTWEDKALVVRARIKELEDQRDNADADEKLAINDQIAEQNKELQDQATEQTEARQKLTQGTWRQMKIAARESQRNNVIWAYWREWVFLLGSITLTLGLITMSFHAEGAERWVSLMMLAIITFSLYVGGIAWAASLSTLLPG